MPFFILAGELMNAGGVTALIIRFALALVGHIRGGLGHVSVVTNMIMAGMSGSALADTAATGMVLIPTMVKAGFAPGFAASLIAASGAIGPMIPPSIASSSSSTADWPASPSPSCSSAASSRAC